MGHNLVQGRNIEKDDLQKPRNVVGQPRPETRNLKFAIPARTLVQHNT